MNKYTVLKCWMFSFEAGGFSCSLDVLRGGLGINVKPKILQNTAKFYLFCYKILGSQSDLTYSKMVDLGADSEPH
jgi:hypothetical protein